MSNHKCRSFSKRFLILSGAVLLAACAARSDDVTGNASEQVTAGQAERPNFLVVMFDDMGYSDLGSYGGEINTPTMDALAQEGIRFRHFYNASRCSPSRASLMTGLYPHRTGLGDNGASMHKDNATIAEVLRDNGYNTAMVGKWHLTQANALPDPEEHLKWLAHDPKYADLPFGDESTYPVARGFERHYGPIWGVVDFFDPFSLVEGTEPVESVPDDYYITTALTDKTIEYIDAMSGDEKPFFLYLAHTAPHWPIHALPEDVAKYEGVYEDGWSVLRETRYSRQVDMGLIKPEKISLPPIENDKSGPVGASGEPDWNEMTAQERAYYVDKMQSHAAMVDRADQELFRIISHLKETGQYENTVIIILSDNGASPEIVQKPGYDRPGYTREGDIISFADDDKTVPPWSQLKITGIGPSWANAANTPWRYWKREPYEGGIRTPFIFSFPAMNLDRGSIVDAPGHVMDVAPTIYRLAGVDYAQSGRGLPPLDGTDITQFIAKDQAGEGRTLFFEHEAGRAVISGHWKLVSMASVRAYQPWRLYDLRVDQAETNDVIDQYPDVAERLITEWQAWADEVQVVAPQDKIDFQ